MKWLFRIVVYLFPRRRWREVRRHSMTMNRGIEFLVVEQRDQFGNIRDIRIPSSLP